MPPADPALRAWWPATQAMELVAGGAEEVAEAVLCEYRNFAAAAKPDGLLERLLASKGRPSLGWHADRDLDAAFRLVGDSDNCATKVLVLPTHSQWTVLWINSFLCDGYDSLAYCLTSHHGMRTIHWSAHDS